LLKKAAEEAARQQDITITTAIDDEIEAKGNPTEMVRVMSNLIENARRYGKTVSIGVAELNLSATVKSGQAVIELSDCGSGLPPEQIAYLLRPFTRLDSARGQANGAGLGLAIVDRVVLRHQGKLEILNRDGGGLMVRVILPVT
jgi:two-component system osmolarity sensor histidine kinase EnvZ